MGLPDGILCRAKKLMGEGEVKLEEILTRLQSEECRLKKDITAYENLCRETEQIKGRYIQLKERLDGDKDFVLLDVRRAEEYDSVCFPDHRCLHVPVADIMERVSEIPKDKEIIIYCATSIRAYIVERTLRGMGYEDVKILDGSLDAWPFPDLLTG